MPSFCQKIDILFNNQAHQQREIKNIIIIIIIFIIIIIIIIYDSSEEKLDSPVWRASNTKKNMIIRYY